MNTNTLSFSSLLSSALLMSIYSASPLAGPAIDLHFESTPLSKLAAEINSHGGHLIVDPSLAVDRVNVQYLGDNWVEAALTLSSNYEFISVTENGKVVSLSIIRRKGTAQRTPLAKSASAKPAVILYDTPKSLPQFLKDNAPDAVFNVKLPLAVLRASKIGDKIKLNLPDGDLILTQDTRYDYIQNDNYDGDKAAIKGIAGGFTWVGHGNHKDQQLVFTSSADGTQIYGTLTTNTSVYQISGDAGEILMVELTNPSLRDRIADDTLALPEVTFAEDNASDIVDAALNSDQPTTENPQHVFLSSGMNPNGGTGVGPVIVRKTSPAGTLTASASNTVNVTVEVDMCVFGTAWAPPGYNITHLQQVIALTNQALVNSNITGAVNLAAYGFQLSGSPGGCVNGQPIHPLLVGTFITDTLNSMSNFNPAISTTVPNTHTTLGDSINAIRAYGMDLGVIWRPLNSALDGVNINGQQGVYCGLAWINGNGRRRNASGGWRLNPYEAMAVVNFGAPCNDDAFTHELGHLFGSNHAHYMAGVNNTNGGIDARAYGHGVSGVWGTMMTYEVNHLQRFSNPNQQSCGSPVVSCGVSGTGANAADNRYVFDRTIPIVATFR